VSDCYWHRRGKYIERERRRNTHILSPRGLSPEGQRHCDPYGEHGQVALTTPHGGKSEYTRVEGRGHRGRG